MNFWAGKSAIQHNRKNFPPWDPGPRSSKAIAVIEMVRERPEATHGPQWLMIKMGPPWTISIG